MQYTKSVGLDVHKKTIALACSDAAGGNVRSYGVIENRLDTLLKVLRKLGKAASIQVAYEAGPTGYGLYHALRKAGYACMVVAPSLIPSRPGDRVKTDRRDAEQLARLLSKGELTGVTVPAPDQEALRDLCRARGDVVQARLKARQRLGAMLLRHERRFSGKRYWTKSFRLWLSNVVWEYANQRLAFEEYVRAVDEAEARVSRLTQALEDACLAHPLANHFVALQALRGVSLVVAATIVSELGDLTRFSKPGQLMACVGLVPSEHSSGSRIRRGSITKCGNAHVRRMLTEAAWNYRFPARVGREMLKRQHELPDSIRGIAFAAQARLCRQYHRMTHAGKDSRVIVTAIARELLGFAWSIAREMKALASRDAA